MTARATTSSRAGSPHDPVIEVVAEVDSDRARQELASAWARWRDRWCRHQPQPLGVRGGFANDVIHLRAAIGPIVGGTGAPADGDRPHWDRLTSRGWTFFAAIRPAPAALEAGRELAHAIRDLGRVPRVRKRSAGPRGARPRVCAVLRELVRFGTEGPTAVLDKTFSTNGYARLDYLLFYRASKPSMADAAISAALVDACRAAFEHRRVELGWLSLVDDRGQTFEIIAALDPDRARGRHRSTIALADAQRASRDLGYEHASPLRLASNAPLAFASTPVVDERRPL